MNENESKLTKIDWIKINQNLPNWIKTNQNRKNPVTQNVLNE